MLWRDTIFILMQIFEKTVVTPASPHHSFNLKFQTDAASSEQPTLQGEQVDKIGDVKNELEITFVTLGK